MTRFFYQTTQGEDGVSASSRGSFDTYNFEEIFSDNGSIWRNFSSQPAQNSLRFKEKSFGTGSILNQHEHTDF
jgi:hypothetical protein